MTTTAHKNKNLNDNINLIRGNNNFMTPFDAGGDL